MKRKCRGGAGVGRMEGRAGEIQKGLAKRVSQGERGGGSGPTFTVIGARVSFSRYMRYSTNTLYSQTSYSVWEVREVQTKCGGGGRGGRGGLRINYLHSHKCPSQF